MAQAQIIDGKAFAEKLRARVGEEVAKLKALHRVQPGLAVVAGGRGSRQPDLCEEQGRADQGRRHAFRGASPPGHRHPGRDRGSRDKLNADKNIHGILVQLPLPNGLDSAPVIAAIDPDKDVDGLTITNAGRLASGLPGLVPCTPAGCLMLAKDVLGDLKGKTAVVVGRSNLMGKPMAQLLLQADCTVTIAHSRTQDLRASAVRPTSWSPPSAGRK